MQKTYYLIMILANLAFTISTGAQNLIANPDFEDGFTNDAPQAWQLVRHDSCKVTPAKDHVFSGATALQIELKDYPETLILTQNIDGPFTEDLYEFSFYAKGESLESKDPKKTWSAYVQLCLYDQSKMIHKESFSLGYGQTDWQEHKRLFTIPAEVERVAVLVGGYRSKGVVFLDRFCFGPKQIEQRTYQKHVQETFLCGANWMTLAEAHCAGITAITHVPPQSELYAAAAKLGIKIMPYVSAIKIAKSDEGPWGPCVLRHSFWKEIDAVEHPDWQAWHRDAGGNPAEYSVPYYPYFKLGCHYQPGFRQAIARGALNLLADGASGIFVDNVSEYRFTSLPCSGPVIGKHTHPEDTKDQFDYYIDTLSNLYSTLKTKDPGFIVFINAGLFDVYGGYSDLSMHENVLQLPLVWPGKNLPPDYSALEHRHLNWHRFWTIYQQLQNYQDRYQADIYTSTSAGDVCVARRHLFYSFVFSRLVGYNQWGCGIGGPYSHGRRWGRITDTPALRSLYRALNNLGEPLAPPKILAANGMQQFEKASLALNPTLEDQTVIIPVQQLELPVADLASARPLTVSAEGTAALRLPFYSGGVIMSRTDVLRDNVRELQGLLDSIHNYLSERIEQTNPKFKNDEALNTLSALRQALQDLPENLTERDRRAFNALTMQLAELSPAAFLHDFGAYLSASQEKPEPEKVRELFSSPAGRLAPPEIRESGDARYLIGRSAGASYSFEPHLQYGADAFLNYDSAPLAHVDCTAERPTHWLSYPHVFGLRFAINMPLTNNQTAVLTPDHLEKIDIIADNADEQKILLRYRLKNISQTSFNQNLKFLLLVGLKQGSPFLSVEAELENSTEDLSTALIQISSFSQTSRAATGQDADGKIRWLYLPAEDHPRAGQLFVGQPELCFAKNRLSSRPGGKLAFSLLALTGHDYYFLESRLRFARLAASRLAQLLNDVYLDPAAPLPPKAFIGDPFKLDLTLGGTDIADAEFTMQADLTEVNREGNVRTLQVNSAGAGAFEIPVLSGALGDVLMLNGAATVHTLSAGSFHAEDMWLLRLYEPVNVNLTRLPAREEGQCRYELKIENHSALTPFNGTAEFLPEQQAVSIKPPKYEIALAPANEYAGEFLIQGKPDMLNTLEKGRFELKQAQKTLFNKSYDIHFSPFIHVPRLKQKPLLDGNLQDDAWRTAVELPALRRTRSGITDTATKVWLGYDDEALYLAFYCDNYYSLNESNEDETPGEDDAALRLDSVEIYLKPDFKNKATESDRLGVNCYGRYKSESLTGFTTAVLRNETYWTLEVAIPFAALKMPPPAAGDVWSGNVCRTYHAASSQERYGATWSFISRGYNQPSEFGWLYFE